MQNKKLPILLFSLILILYGCVTNSPKASSNPTSIEEYKNWLYLSYDNTLRLEMTEYVMEFSNILSLIKENEKNDEQYVLGRVDGFLSRNILSVHNILNEENMDNATYKLLMNSELIEPLKQLMSNLASYVRELKDNKFDKIETESINQLIKLSQVFNTGGTDLFTDEKEYKNVLKSVEKMNDLLSAESNN